MGILSISNFNTGEISTREEPGFGFKPWKEFELAF